MTMYEETLRLIEEFRNAHLPESRYKHQLIDWKLLSQFEAFVKTRKR